MWKGVECVFPWSTPSRTFYLSCFVLCWQQRGRRVRRLAWGPPPAGSNGCDAERESQAHGDLCRISRPWRLISCFLSHRGLRAKPKVWLMIFPQPQQAFPVPCGGSSSSLLHVSACSPELSEPGAGEESVVAGPMFSASASPSLCALGQLLALSRPQPSCLCSGDDTHTLHMPHF